MLDEAAMNRHSCLIVLFVVLALTGCAPVAAGPGLAPNTPNSQSEPRDTSGNALTRSPRIDGLGPPRVSG